MTQPRVEVSLDGDSVFVLAKERRVAELSAGLGVDENVALVLVRGEVWRWLAPEDVVTPSVGWDLRREARPVYVPNEKHKRVPSIGVKGTFCPDVDARLLLAGSYRLASRLTRCWAVSDGCAFEGKYDNAGGWHGYPVRYRLVPVSIWRLWVVDGKSISADWASDTLCEG